MANHFQKNHIFQILHHFEEETLPLDVFLSQYFRHHKSVGANDRRVICEAIYGMIRWRGLLDHLLSPQELSWEKRFSLFLTIDPLHYSNQEKIPPHIRASFPKHFFQLLSDAYGEKQALELCYTSNTQAPTTVRVNEIKTSREALFEKWKEHYPISLCTSSPWGIIFHKRINFFSLPEFKEGLFEIQDEGSQMVARLLSPKPGDQILDYCSGSGGKTLAIAPLTQHRGQIYLHDIRPRVLLEAKKRLRRAGIQNAQVLPSDDPHKQTLKGKMDWVLLDVPCTGSGTVRRNPDMKWKFNSETVSRLVEEQRQIFQEGLEFLSPKGKLVYATCSIFPQENQDQIAYFEKHFPVVLEGSPFFSLPQKGGMDGFFGAVLRKK